MYSKLAALAAGMMILAGTAPASAGIVSVDAHSGPWDPTIAGNYAYGDGSDAGATKVGVNAGDNLTITYVSGLTTAFGGTPTVDGLGYVDGVFGSGTGLSGIGSSGNPFPATEFTGLTDPDVWLNELIGVFVDGSGVMIGDGFAIGNGPYAIIAPVGAVFLQLGFNDDIFSDNDGALKIEVDGSTVAQPAPEPLTLSLFGAGLAGIGAVRRRKRA